jgi:hypothetical protein
MLEGIVEGKVVGQCLNRGSKDSDCSLGEVDSLVKNMEGLEGEVGS